MTHVKWLLHSILFLLPFNAFPQSPSPFLLEPAYTNLDAALKNKADATSLALHYKGAITEDLRLISQLSNLKHLSITGIYLPSLPDEIFKLKNLRTLQLQCSLREIPQQLIALEQLEYLDLTRNSINDIPDWINEMPNLKTLILNANPIKKVGDNIARCKKLRSLHLRGIHELKTIPETIGRMSNLEELYINNNRLYRLPESVKGLKKLRVLDASSNHLEDLPQDITSLRKLEVLNLSINKISKLPSHFNQLQSLKNLNLSYNPIEDDPKLKFPVSLQQVKFIKSRLTAFPESLKHCTNLESLEITQSGIGIIPQWIGRLQKLKVLASIGNKITAIPPILHNNKQLNRINLNSNLIDSIPSEIFSLPRLQYLLLADNKIPSVPGEIAQSNSLEYFAVKESYIRDSTAYQQLKISLKGRIVFEPKDLVKFQTMGDCPCYSEEQLPRHYRNIPPSEFTKTEITARFGNYSKNPDRFFADNVNFPNIALSLSANNTFSDTVLVTFVVSPSPHQLTYVNVVSSRYVETTTEAVRLLRLSCPYWHPAVIGGREVKAWARVLFIFKQFYENGELRKGLTGHTSQKAPLPTR